MDLELSCRGFNDASGAAEMSQGVFSGWVGSAHACGLLLAAAGPYVSVSDVVVSWGGPKHGVGRELCDLPHPRSVGGRWIWLLWAARRP